MEIIRSGTRSSLKLSPDYFTGTARLDAVIDEHQGANVTCGHVTFEPSARTNWHTHPRGQAIIITFGLGLVQKDGEPIEEVRPGDVVWFEPGERHWHGASPNTAMSHFAVQELENGTTVDCLEPVSDADYSRSR